MPNNTESKTIPVTHLNVRQSISFMLLKLFILELISAFIILTICFPLACIEFPFITVQGFFTVHNILYIILITFKVFLMLLVVLQWLNEYYEILPNKLIHRKGVLFKNEEDYAFTHLMSIDFQQGVLGGIFNYGTVHMYDRYINKHIYLYLIHNPQKYFKILKNLMPVTDTEQTIFRGKLEEYEEK